MGSSLGPVLANNDNDGAGKCYSKKSFSRWNSGFLCSLCRRYPVADKARECSESSYETELVS